MSCSKSLKKKYTSRPAPPYPAQNCKNIIKTGNNGKKYKSVSNKNGIYKWKLIQSKRTSTKSYKKMNKFTVDYAAKNINKLITVYCREYKDEEPKKSDWIQNKCGTHYKLKFRPNGNAGIVGKKQRIENWLISQKPPIKNLYTWFTEYELNPLWPKKSEKVTVHPNSVYSIHGIKLSLTEKSKSNLETILCRRLKKKTFLSDGTVLYLELGKKDKFQSIILNCKSIKTAAKFFKNYETTIFEGQNGIYVDNISVDRKVMWDIIVVQN